MIAIPWLNGIRRLGSEDKSLIGLLACKVITSVASTSVIPFILLYLTKEVGFAVSLATAAMTILAISPGIAGPVVGYYHDRTNSKALIAAACALAIVAFILLLKAHGRTGIVFLALGLLGLANSVFAVSFNAALPRFLSEERLPLAFSLMHSTANIGAMLGPALSGALLLYGKGTAQIMGVAISFYAFAMVSLPVVLPKESVGNHVRVDVKGSVSGGALPPAVVWMSFIYLAYFFLDWAHFEQTNSFLSLYVFSDFGNFSSLN